MCVRGPCFPSYTAYYVPYNCDNLYLVANLMPSFFVIQVLVLLRVCLNYSYIAILDYLTSQIESFPSILSPFLSQLSVSLNLTLSFLNMFLFLMKRESY